MSQVEERTGVYRVRLEQFEGPLDLLLHLIERSKLDIHQIRVSQITGEYLEYMRQIDRVEVERASLFLTMAATLVEIKSRALLPKPPKPDDDDEEDPEQALLRRLEDYKRFKALSQQLQQLEQEQLDTFGKLPEEMPPPRAELDLKGADVFTLLDALLKVLERVAQPAASPAAGEIRRETFTVPERMGYLMRRMRRADGLVRFEALFEPCASRDEVVTTFLALLELMKLGRCRAGQRDTFGSITLVLQ
ncbi:MAG: segregation and condensation protein A [Christensenellales bacterium]